MRKGRRVKVPWSVLAPGGSQRAPHGTQPANHAQPTACRPVERLVLWSGVQLARRRRYTEAESVLACLSSSGSEVRAEACDLLARIRVRQWRYADADALWAKAEGLVPDRHSYSRAREVVWLVPVLWRTLVALFVAILVVLAFAAGLNASRRGDNRQDAAERAAPIGHVSSEQDGGSDQQ